MSVLEPYIFLPPSFVTLVSFFQPDPKEARVSFAFKNKSLPVAVRVMLYDCQPLHERGSYCDTNKYHIVNNASDVITFIHRKSQITIK